VATLTLALKLVDKLLRKRVGKKAQSAISRTI
jgi:hypothetical protein